MKYNFLNIPLPDANSVLPKRPRTLLSDHPRGYDAIANREHPRHHHAPSTGTAHAVNVTLA